MWQKGPSKVFDDIDLDELRARLAKMSDKELTEFGKAARFMCSPRANFGKAPREAFVVQLEEAQKEWSRRNPQSAKTE